MISRLRKLIPTPAKLQIVKSAILPHLTHCQLIWHFCRASEARKLEKLQQSAPRAVYCKKSATYEKLLRWADTPTLRTRRLYEMATVMYTVKNSLSPSYLADLFKLNNSGYHLRNSYFIIPRFNSVTHGKHSLRYLGPTIRAKLDSYIRSSKTPSIFKKRIKHVKIGSLIGQGCDNYYLCEN